MLVHRCEPSGKPRAGVVLLVVISLLMLFATVGLAFVIYAETQASTARVRKESEMQRRADVDPEELLAYFLGQLIYDTNNPHSVLRGHSLARTMYGRPGGTRAFCGTGRLPDDARNINYAAGGDPNQSGSGNPPYTYPDLNNVFLAAVRGRDGAVLIPSYQRQRFGCDPNDRRQTLRPVPAEHAGFPEQEDAGGDVKNLPGPGTLIGADQFASNDSIWLDLGHPVLTAADGRKYKPLFAPLIQDLDNRVNVNVHGNIVAPLGDAGGDLNGGLDTLNGRHSSHQGWGPWEVDLGRILAATEPPSGTPPGYEHWVNYEVRYLFTGSKDKTLRGRYDLAFWGEAGTKNQLLEAYLPRGPSYAPTNSEGDSGDVSAPPPNMTGDRFTLSNNKCFPNYSGWGWENGDPVSGGRNHQAIWNFFNPARTAAVPNNPPRDDRIFKVSNMETLLRYGDSGSPALDSDLFRLCPRSLQDPKARRLITTHSFDLAVPGVMPGLHGEGMSYRFGMGSPYPVGQPVAFPAGGGPPPGGEFNPDWTAKSAELSRIDLNRPLVNYPSHSQLANPNAATLQTFDKAQQARIDLARDLFEVLRQVTGAADPAAAAGEELDAVRWLAQLAVNIVDYIDKDDYLTPFEWRPGEHVFGVELPRLVLNEAYVEIANHEDDTGNMAKQPFQVRFWIELYSPTGSATESNKVRLRRTGAPPEDACYKIAIVKEPRKLTDRDNVRGEPDKENDNLVLELSDYTPADDMQQWDGTVEAGKYLILGPDAEFPGGELPSPNVQVKKNDDLPVTSDLAYDVENDTSPDQFPTKHTLLLRRLACPSLPHQPNPAGGSTPYNPYVTVDYLQDVPVNDAVKATRSGQRQNAPETVNDVAKRVAKGRKQPYAAALLADQKPTTPLQDQPQHTFAKQNVPAPNDARPYRWLAFMDRPLVSPIELLQVSSCSPHELTQRFVREDGAGNQQPNGHLAPWLDESARIYRLLEFLQAGMFVQGNGPGGRSVGRININTIWDQETFNALCDARIINRFKQSDVDDIYRRFTAWRTPDEQPGANDRPFLGFAAPPLLPGPLREMGIQRTLLAADTADANPDPLQQRRLFEPATLPTNVRQHPYMKYELLNKIANHVTTRSNVFAVWLTVGFFEVKEEGGPNQPPRLGAEIGRAEGRHVRHRMFAIIDRSNLTFDPANPGLPGPRPFFLNTTGAADAGSNTITIGATLGNYEDLRYEIKVKDRLVIDSGSRREVVTVTAIADAAGGLKQLAVQPPFQKRHELGVPVTNVGAATVLGHPGPQPRFDHRNPLYQGVVRYFSIIE